MIDKRDVFSLGGLDLVNEVIDMYEQKDKIKVLDVGCGSGYSVNYLSQQGFDATGIDASEEIIEIGKKKYKNVNINEWYFQGHFPGNPIMPGVLITEALAQTGAVAILSMEENKGKNALFGGIDKMKFKKMVVPGDVLKLEVKIIKKKGPIGVGEAVATVDGKIAAKGELTFAIV